LPAQAVPIKIGMQGASPQMLGMPAAPSAWTPPQNAPASQLPQFSVLPHPSGAVPHW
jgi:hypothetical protein